MSDLITRLQSFNRKERFILLREALGGRTFSLEAGFRERLGALIGVRVPTDAFVAMDYHLDWLQMALFLARTPTPPQFIPKGDVLSEGQEDLNANQMDIDLLVAFDTEAKTHLVLLEAKMETGWSNLQMRRKAKRLRQIFGDHPHSDVARPHFVLLSRTRPQRLEAGKWPAWMKRDGKPVWMELPRPDGLCKVTRCGEDGAPSQGGGFLRVDRLAGSTSHSHSVASASSTTFLETVEKLSPLMDALKSGEERLWHEYGEAPAAGVYALYEQGEATYVGRSNGMRDRIREHGADSSDRHSATFAFKLLREELDGPAGAAKEIEAAHREEFRHQRERVRAMTFRAVPIEDQLEQTLFETYAILELGTHPEHNDFDTH